MLNNDAPAVTVGEYQEFLEANPSQRKPLRWDEQLVRPRRPVIGVSPTDADAYFAWRGEGRLLTDEEYDEWVTEFDAMWTITSTVEDGLRVLRGGSFFNNADDLRADFRYWLSPDDRHGLVGFRVVSSRSSVLDPLASGSLDSDSEAKPE